MTATTPSATALDSLLEACGCIRRDVDVEPVDRDRLAVAVRRISASFERAASAGDISAVWGALGVGFADARLIMLTWLELLEEIAQIAEQRFGKESGHGEFKSAQVKAAIRRTVNQSSSPLRDTVTSFGPGVIDIAVDAALIVVVGLLDSRNLWEQRTLVATKRPRETLRFRIGRALVGWFGKLYALFSLRQPLDPALLDNVEVIVSSKVDPLSIADKAVVALRWVADNPTQVEALMDVVATACAEAETFFDLDGPSKQAYARELTFVVLEEQFGLEFTGITRVVVAALIDVVIDFVVTVNVKRGAFDPAKHSPRV